MKLATKQSEFIEKDCCCIYKITSPSGKIYVGQTVSLKRRLVKYKNLSCKRQTKLYASFVKYGYLSHSIEVIEGCERSLLNERERFWQEYFCVIGTNGLNLCLTNSALKDYVASQETRNRISNANRGPNHYFFGKKHDEETKRKISLSMSGEKCYMYGAKRSREFIDNLIKSKKIKVEKFGNADAIEVIHVDTLVRYKSIKDAAEGLGVGRSFLSMCIAGKRINKIGVVRYKDYLKRTDEVIAEIKSNREHTRHGGGNANAKAVYNSKTNRHYSCIKDAAVDLGISPALFYNKISDGSLPSYLTVSNR